MSAACGMFLRMTTLPSATTLILGPERRLEHSSGLGAMTFTGSLAAKSSCSSAKIVSHCLGMALGPNSVSSLEHRSGWV